MNTFEFADFNEMYKTLTELLLKQDLFRGTRELNNVLFSVSNTENAIIAVRNPSVSYLCGELLWYMSGSNDVNFISNFSKRWLELTDDGETNNSAYGHILLKRHGFNQLDKIVELIKSDRGTRRAVLNFNVPNENVIETKDEICTIAVQFLLRDNKLECTTMMRSNDIYFGTPYDIAFFVSLQKIVAKKLNVMCGKYTHFATSLHLYERDREKLIASLRLPPSKITLNSENLLLLDENDYEIVSKSKSPKTDVINLFVEKGIIEL